MSLQLNCSNDSEAKSNPAERAYRDLRVIVTLHHHIGCCGDVEASGWTAGLRRTHEHSAHYTIAKPVKCSLTLSTRDQKSILFAKPPLA